MHHSAVSMLSLELSDAALVFASGHNCPRKRVPIRSQGNL